MTKYYEKITLSGNIIEVMRYEKLNTKGGGARTGDGADREHNYKQSQRRRRNAIRQLICTNFDSGSKFVTLTFSDQVSIDIRNVQACNKYFKQFVQRVRRRYPDFAYVAVIEFQDRNGRGAVHYHMISNLPYIAKQALMDIWQGGFVKINSIDKVDNVGAYVIKYMTEDMDDTRLQSENAYLHSRGLKKPIELKSWDESTIPELREIEAQLQEKVPSYSAKYESTEAGHIEYYQYNLSRK